jgi:hypothetical protein
VDRGGYAAALLLRGSRRRWGAAHGGRRLRSFEDPRRGEIDRLLHELGVGDVERVLEDSSIGPRAAAFFAMAPREWSISTVMLCAAPSGRRIRS